jgi:hypothetical protein
MAWKTTKRTLAKRSLEMLSDTADLWLPEGSEFAVLENISDEKYKKVTLTDNSVLYVPSASLVQV